MPGNGRRFEAARWIFAGISAGKDMDGMQALLY